MAENDKPSPRLRMEGAVPADCAGVMVYTTFPDLDVAERVARELVQERLAGCINILPGMVSVYIWEGSLERGQEVVLIAKTTAGAAEACMAAIADRHPYQTPAILALPVAAGAEDYLAWIRAGTGPPT